VKVRIQGETVQKRVSEEKAKGVGYLEDRGMVRIKMTLVDTENWG